MAYTPTGNPTTQNRYVSANLRAEFQLIADAINNPVDPNFTGQNLGPAGSASLPSYSFTLDPNTGMYSPGADQLAWSTGGTRRMSLDSSGNFGLGTPPIATAQAIIVKSSSSTSVSETGLVVQNSASPTSGAVSKTALLAYTLLLTGYAASSSAIGVQGGIQMNDAGITAPSALAVVGSYTSVVASTVTNLSLFYASFANSGGGTVGSMQAYRAPDYSNNNYDGFRSDIASGTGKHGFYATGTAQNTFIGTTTIGTNTANASGAKLQTVDGITFPAVQVASSDANTLDDYAEGNFTPSIVGGTLAGVGTYAYRTGRYVKIGKAVHFTLRIDWSAHTGTGNLTITGMPFTSEIVSNMLTALNMLDVNIPVTAGNVAKAYISNGADTVLLQQVPVGGGVTGSVAMSASGNLTISGTYFV